jgi:hypothetical protein
LNRKSMWMLAAMAAGSLYAQQAATEVAALKQAYAGIKGNLIKAAEKMPEDQYGFKASPDIRTFGGLIAHIADVQARVCSAAAGSAPPAAGEKTAKADLVAALNDSFKICDGVFDSLTDADAGKTISLGRGGARNEFATLWTLIIGHSNEEYGYLAVYMRIKGVVPPSSEGRGR